MLFVVIYVGWCLFITFGAGFLGAGLNCEYGCWNSEPVQWLKPWTFGNYYVFPEVFFVGLAGLVSGTIFAVALIRQRRLIAVVGLTTSLVLLAYPSFAGLTAQGRPLFWIGPVFGLMALAISRLAGQQLSANR